MGYDSHEDLLVVQLFQQVQDKKTDSFSFDAARQMSGMDETGCRQVLHNLQSSGSLAPHGGDGSEFCFTPQGVQFALDRWKSGGKPDDPDNHPRNSTLQKRLEDDGWKVVGVLGTGAQAIAFEVTKDDGETRYVAKVLRPWVSGVSKAESEAVQRGRFIAEVNILKKLNELGCPGILQVHDSKLDAASEGQPYFVTELLAGGGLCRSWERGEYAEEYRGNLERVLEIAEQVAHTLAFMHKCEGGPVVHRDVHAGNVFLREVGGEVFLGDFGIAYAGAESGGPSHETLEVEPFGPWRWRPPELKSGSMNKRDPASDVFMLGGLIYELITGGKYIEDTEIEAGKLTHMTDGMRISECCEDERAKYVEELLSRCFRRLPVQRMTAEAVAESCARIQAWSKGDRSPVLKSVEEEVRELSLDLSRSPEAVRQEEARALVERCRQLVRERFSDERDEKLGTVFVQIRANYADASMVEAGKKLEPQAVWAVVRVKVAGDGHGIPPGVRQMGYVLLGRNENNQLVLAELVQGSESPKLVSRHVDGDPALEDAIVKHVSGVRTALLKRAVAAMKDPAANA